MKKNKIFHLTTAALLILFLSAYTPPTQRLGQDEYLVLTWNDLGMHCANKDFSKIVILPPYNNLISHVIKRGTETTWPEVITSEITVEYEIPGNTYSVDKTNFWDYEDQIFGVNLPDNIGLTGAGLTGEMEVSGNAFTIEGIPITPFTDDNLISEDPFQLALVSTRNNQGTLLASTQNVIPVSNEISCVSSGCHSSENDILDQHSDDGGFDPNDTPILCANCHGSNALGLPGLPRYGSLSEVIHDKHKGKTNDCYKCHPGSNAQCQRGVMHAAGMICQDCHGNMRQVAESIKEGREPWLEEPRCGATACHGSQYAEEPEKLYRNSKGHGGLYCSACHGSPHALVPSTLERDNVQNTSLQGYAGILNNCVVCHGYMPSRPGPHGLYAPQTTTQQINLNAGWNSLSSYLIPVEQNVEDIFSPLAENLIILSSLEGVYWPDQQINSIGKWDSDKGYIIKLENEATLNFWGIKEADKEISLEMAWTILPILSPCQVLVQDFLTQNPGEIRIIKEIAGTKVYWPELEIYSLSYLVPGRAYYIYAYNDVDFVYPECK